MPRKGENIYKRKDGRWEGRYIKGRDSLGKAKYGYVYARTYKEAKQKLISKAILERDKSTNETRLNNSELSFIAVQWLDIHKGQLKYSSYVKYYNILNVYILPYFTNKKIEEITSIDLNRFVEYLLTRGGTQNKGLSTKTVNDIFSVFRAILKYASEQGYHPGNNGGCITIKQHRKEFSILSPKDLKKLIKYLESNLSPKNLGILLSLYSGLRIGEICALRWEDVSLDDGIIYVHSTMQRLQTNSISGPKTQILITAPKSLCSIRKIPLSENVLQILKNTCFSHSGFILTGKENQFVEPRTYENYFKKVLIECQIEKTTFHTLRHTFATKCIEVGVDMKCISEILGHSNISITMNRYVHPSMEVKRNQLKKLSNIFSVK